MLPVVNKLVVAAAGVKTNCVSPATEISKSTSLAALDSITEPVAQTSVPAALKVRVLTPPVVSFSEVLQLGGQEEALEFLVRER